MDSGASASLINKWFVKEHNIPCITLATPLHFTNVDGTQNTAGPITHKVDGHFNIQGHPFPVELYVANCGQDNIILGLPWLLQYNPSINWINGQICFNPQYLQAKQKLWEY